MKPAEQIQPDESRRPIAALLAIGVLRLKRRPHGSPLEVLEIDPKRGDSRPRQESLLLSEIPPQTA